MLRRPTMFLQALLVLGLAAQGGFSPSGSSAPAKERDAREATAPVARAKRWTLEQILDALRLVETGGEKDGGRHSTGDSGGAIGPFQVHRAYWIDARVPGRWEDCRDPRYARAVVVAYWKRYCPKALEALDAETLARVHNGGPDGAREKATLPFWRKVERALVKQAEERAVREAKAKRGDARPVPASGGKVDPKPAPKPPATPAEKREGWV